MILVDSSVWIDLLANRDTPQTRRFEQFVLAQQQLGLGDMMLVEVLQGIRSDREYDRSLARLSAFPQTRISDQLVAKAAAQNFRTLRSMGITVRKTIDTLIATRCILDGFPLLFADRDFHPFVEHLNMRSALDDTGLN